MVDLAVGALLRLSRRVLQRPLDIGLGDGLEIGRFGQRVLPEALTVIPPESVGIRRDPGFHGLDHQVGPSESTSRTLNVARFCATACLNAS